jgi:hypothetical protein
MAITVGIVPPVPQTAAAGINQTTFVLTTDITTVAVCAASRANATARQRMVTLQAQFDAEVTQIVCASAGISGLGPAPAQVVLSDTLQVNQAELVFGVYQVWAVRRIQLTTTCI